MAAGMTIPRPADEAGRLAALRRYRLLDTPREADFDYLTKMAAALCGTPTAFVSLVDDERVWYKSAYGRQVLQAARDDDYCAWAILERDGLCISDLRADARTASLSLTTASPRYRSYFGVNLTSADGYRIGTLCVLDYAVRTLSRDILALLELLASHIMRLIEQRGAHLTTGLLPSGAHGGRDD